MKTLRKIFDKVTAVLGKVKLPGILGQAWAWVAWGITSVLNSVWQLFLSPKVWPAAILFGCVGWIGAFHLGRVPAAENPAAPVKVASVPVCSSDRLLSSAQADIAALKDQLAKAQTEFEAKPKVVYRTRRAPAKKANDSFAINWPKF